MGGRPGGTQPAAVAVVVPAYRVARHIAAVVRGIPPWVRAIIVVDDASPDDIAEAIQGIGDPRLRLVRHERNRGVGGAVMTGYEEAIRLGCRILVKVDGDGQMDPSRIRDLILPIEHGRADYTKGNRFLHRAELQKMPLLRRFGNTILTFLTKSASGYWSLYDPANGFTAIHSVVWEQLERDRIDSRYFFETSMLIELGCARAVVEDVPIPAIYADEASSLSVTRTAVEFPFKLLWGFLRRIRTWYFLYDFTPVSLFLLSGPVLIAFSLIFGGIHWWQSYRTGIPATTGTVMLAVVTLILGFQLVLQALALDMQSMPRSPLQAARPLAPDEDPQARGERPQGPA
jgi:dolichol-phosphate mannosyltransferase